MVEKHVAGKRGVAGRLRGSFKATLVGENGSLRRKTMMTSDGQDANDVIFRNGCERPLLDSSDGHWQGSTTWFSPRLRTV